MVSKTSSLSDKTGYRLKNKLLTDTQLSKLPPQATEVEETVLGALMLEKDALATVVDILKPESFYKEAHQEIYRSILDLFNDSQPVDLMTVGDRLRKSGKLEMVGGAYYVAQLTSRVSSAANIEYHARIISEQSIKRDLIRISSEIQRDAYEDTTDVFHLLDRAEASLFEVSESHIRKNYSDIKAIMHSAFSELEAKREQKGLTGVPSGFTDLDRITNGWQKSELIIIAARPGMGKTAFVISAMCNAALDHKIPVAMFSLEMSSIQLVNRLISSQAELENGKLKNGNLAEYEWEQMIHKTAGLSEAPIYIDDTPALSVLELRAKCRRLKSKHGIQLVIVDYLQLMAGDVSRKNNGNREQEISSISRSLKGISKELNVPVIALSQLSRQVEQRGGDKRPQLSDLRESGAIEQDADMVMFLYRPEYYGITEIEGIPTYGMADVIVSKHRNGSLGETRLRFITKYTKFTDMDSFGNNSEVSSAYQDSYPAPVNSQTFSSRINEMDDKSKKDKQKTSFEDEGPF